MTAEEDYVNQMLAPSMSFQEEMKHHGGDFDGDGHISQHEVDMYRQVQLLSMTNDKVDMLDQHMTNHMFGEYEIMTRYVVVFFCLLLSLLISKLLTRKEPTQLIFSSFFFFSLPSG